MLNDFLQNQAALYAAGCLTPDARADFEVLVDFDEELRGIVAGFAETGARLLPPVVRDVRPPTGLKTRIVEMIDQRAAKHGPEAKVVCGPDGLFEWANAAFFSMCGYSQEELKGRKPGSFLQGAETDPKAAGRLRQAVRERLPVTETILNYHKNGQAYWVDISITPILDDEGELLWFVARERELRDGTLA